LLKGAVVAVPVLNFPLSLSLSLSHSSIQKSPLFATKGKRIIMIMIQTNQQANQQTNKASNTSSYYCLEYSDQHQHF